MKRKVMTWLSLIKGGSRKKGNTLQQVRIMQHANREFEDSGDLKNTFGYPSGVPGGYIFNMGRDQMELEQGAQNPPFLSPRAH